MEWAQFLILLVTIAGLFLWSRSESTSDRRSFEKDSKQLRRDLIDAVRAIEAESKDFHGRLCAIEERKK